MKRKRMFRLTAVFLAMVMCVTAFSVTALASGGEDTAEVTGGKEPDSSESAAAESDTEKNGDVEEPASDEESADSDTEAADSDILEQITALLGGLGNVSADGDGIRITVDADGSTQTGSTQTGTVTTGGGNLNVRTGAGLDNEAFTQLPNGTQVEVIGTEDNGWVKILLPEREGYVCGDYLTVSDAATGDGDFSLTLNGDELSALLEQFGGSAGGSAALTPDGNLSLIDDIGTTGGKQFITLQTKAGNTFYLIIDRDDEGEETVHFLNQVDEADLMALTEDGETAPATCTCTEKCEAGAVNTACPVCKDNLTACVGAAPVAEEPAEPTEPEEEAGNSMGGLIVFLVVLLIGGGAALYFFKFKKPKADTKGNDDLDEYDFGEDEDDDEDEPAPEVEDDTGEVETRPLDDYLLDEDEPKKEDEV